MTQPLIINNEFQNDFNLTLQVNTDSIASAIEKSGVQINIDTDQLASVLRSKNLELNIGIDLAKYENVFNENVNLLFWVLIVLFIILVSLCIVSQIVRIYKNLRKKEVIKDGHVVNIV